MLRGGGMNGENIRQIVVHRSLGRFAGGGFGISRIRGEAFVVVAAAGPYL